MAPTQKSNAEPKQKSLMTWFGKGPAATPNSKTTKPSVKGSAKSSASQSQPSSSQEPRTPESKSLDFNALNSSVMASSASSIGRSTPPTSDPIDVDMMSSDEDEGIRVQVRYSL